ncbi:radical SAM protein [Peterkaempfera sp. SMS 1(5)a]|uniref:radical SAM protein n=1 Tax=Peterkaempfera podocarpi TaxID=3232308 RepID=UPI00366BC024
MKQLSMHVTDLCNEKCGFCVVGSPLAKSDSVQYNELINFLIANADEGFDSLNLHGGEPTILPRLMELLETASVFGYPEVQIQTNGRRLKDRGFVDKLKERGVRLFVISLHGADSHVQDCLTQTPGGFAETIEGIRNAKAAGIQVRVNTVITRMNMGQLGNICRLCVELGVDHINISNLHPVGSGYFALDMQAPTVRETRTHLLPVLDELVGQGHKITLEGFPLCVVAPYQRLAIEDGTRFIRMMYQGAVYDNYDEFMDDQTREYGAPCDGCALRSECGGVYLEYAERRGWDEFAAAKQDLLEPAVPNNLP